jgi:hypothetical protein
MCFVFTVSSPSSSPVDPEAAADAAVIDYVTDDSSSFSAELPGKHPHFEHAYIAYSLLSYACIRTATATVFLYLLHSLIIVTCLATLLVILDCLE